MFTLNGVTLKYQSRVLINIPQLTIPQGGFTALIGPNGAGKTTLLTLLAGDAEPTSGNILFNGVPLSQYSVSELSTKRSVLPQTEHIPFALNARAIILMGLMPHQVEPQHPDVEPLLKDLVTTLELEKIIEQPYQRLSGGEQHRVQIARVLIQTLFTKEQNDRALRDKVMLLDEPFNHLDLYHQQQLLRYFKKLTQMGLTIICVMHDLNHALQVSDRVILLKGGEIVGEHTPAQLWQSKKLEEVFKVNFITLNDPQDSRFSTLAFKI